jgi:hypothetical protein
VHASISRYFAIGVWVCPTFCNWGICTLYIYLDSVWLEIIKGAAFWRVEELLAVGLSGRVFRTSIEAFATPDKIYEVATRSALRPPSPPVCIE